MVEKKLNLKLNLTVLVLLLVISVRSQNQYSLDQAIKDARSHCAVSGMSVWMDKEHEILISNLNKKWLPQVNLSAQASYQSETSGIDLSFPGINIPRLSKDQYKIQADISQMIYDGGTNAALKALQKEKLNMDQNGIRLEVDAMVENTILTYFTVMETGIRIQQTDLAIQNLEAVIKKANVAVESGVMLRSESDQLHAEAIKLRNLKEEIQGAHQSALDVLVLLTGKDQLSPLTNVSILPDSTINISANFLAQLDLQKNLISQNLSLEQKNIVPKLAAFAQTGYGKPGLNFLKNEFAPYYLVGLKLTWQLSAFYTYQNQQQLSKFAMEKTDVRKQDILQKKQMRYQQLLRDWQRLEKSGPKDAELVELRKRILATSEVQLANGTITASTYLTRLNDVTEASLTKEINEIKMNKNAWLMQLTMGWL
ncbi:MAG: TolC family protein [Saprospiraceae bacterium]|mgnify:CR=1 FL=1|nr:TolC family protein [Saprospiraceae bacterium]